MDTVAAAPLFSIEDFRARVAIEREPDGDHGDHLLNPDIRDLILRPGLKPAAVLVPVIDRESGAWVLLTKRTEQLRSHSGQVAFPGGRIDPTDASPEEAALRETFEEVGLPASKIEVIGHLPDYVSGTGFRVTPVIGIIRPPFELKLNEHEVDAAFEVPLSFLMDPANHSRDSRVFQERERHFYRMPYEDWMIWGLTAGIIRGLYERLYA